MNRKTKTTLMYAGGAALALGALYYVTQSKSGNAGMMGAGGAGQRFHAPNAQGVSTAYEQTGPTVGTMTPVKNLATGMPEMIDSSRITSFDN